MYPASPSRNLNSYKAWKIQDPASLIISNYLFTEQITLSSLFTRISSLELIVLVHHSCGLADGGEHVGSSTSPTG